MFHKRITLATKPQRGKQTGVILGKGNQITKLTRFHRQHCRWGVGGGRNSCTAELRTKSKIIINFFKKPDKSERRKNSDLDLLCSSSTDEIQIVLNCSLGLLFFYIYTLFSSTRPEHGTSDTLVPEIRKRRLAINLV